MFCHLSVEKSEIILPFDVFKVKEKEVDEKQHDCVKRGKFFGNIPVKCGKKGK